MGQLGKLTGLLDEQQRNEVQILAISPDSPENSQKLAAGLEKRYGSKPHFPLLSDPEHQVIDRYGLLNPRGEGYPHPAVYVIDRQGRVVWRFVETDYKVRAEHEDILKALEQAE